MESSEDRSDGSGNERRGQDRDKPPSDHQVLEGTEEHQRAHEVLDDLDALSPEEYDFIVAAITRQRAAEGKLGAPKKTWVERATGFSEWARHFSRGGLRIIELITAGVLVWFLCLFLFSPDSVSSTIDQLEPFFESGGVYALAILLAALRVPKMIESLFNRSGSGSNGGKKPETT